MGDILLFSAVVIATIVYWIMYVKVVRKPQSDSWYQDVWSISSLYAFPYGSLIVGSAAALGLFAQLNIPEDIAFWLYEIPLVLVFLIGVIGFLGAMGIPLPYPFTPKWVLKKRKEERAKARARRAERKRKREAAKREERREMTSNMS
ncbi:hypothetical protein CJ193_001445 [Pseudoglutamicibacter albus]|uniref:Uncharacterized protein n=1 Tax=Pseudoglutamicibacter cumminsii TaxID=156979 RepID=A0AAP4C768_9MICC|nr:MULTISPECIES: hypothetical protein [Pseudoglutamicibacter]MDK6275539.1 hypothetical protein [Pseudoglutamicibacter cumminsii]PKY80530.1 hypothetical protein CYJ35_04350 [Pseudoglutamicibacter albus]WIK84560.1 hypothetical protein CJ193_001445 [Pseudoglutamicibacter albus]